MPKKRREGHSRNRGRPRLRPGVSRRNATRDRRRPPELIGIDRRFVQQGANTITDADIKKVTDNADAIKQTFAREGPIGRFIDDVEILLPMVRDYWSGRYRQILFWAIAAVAFALLYVLNPLDIIPDVIPIVGYLDDVAVVAVCLAMAEQELHAYRGWKEGQRA